MEKNDWAGNTGKVAIKLITTGNVLALVILVLCLSIIFRLDSADLRVVVERVMSSYLLPLSGWGAFAITLVISKVMLRTQLRQHNQEIARMAKVRDEAIQQTLSLDMPTSKRKK